MKTLYIIRHAKASWNEQFGTDFERGLKKRGIRDALDMGGRLLSQGVSPDLIISSPAVRAIGTAKIIGEILGYAKADIHTDERIYEASLETLVDVLREINGGFQTVLIFGHNPGFHMLGHYLSNEPPEKFPTCCILGLEFDIANWTRIAQRSGKVTLFDYPSNRSAV